MAAPATQISFYVFIREKARNTCPAYNTLPLFAFKRATPSGTHETVGGFTCVTTSHGTTSTVLPSKWLLAEGYLTTASISRFAYRSYMSSPS